MTDAEAMKWIDQIYERGEETLVQGNRLAPAMHMIGKLLYCTAGILRIVMSYLNPDPIGRNVRCAQVD